MFFLRIIDIFDKDMRRDMAPLPCILASSIVRSAIDEIHGELYYVDLESGEYRTVLQYDKDINWDGRGGDRGLRGIAFHNDLIYVAVTHGIIVLDHNFREVGTFTSRHIVDCHEIYVSGDLLYLTSTKTDSIIVFDLLKREFVDGICVSNTFIEMGIPIRFRPDKNMSSNFRYTIHLNSVTVRDNQIFFSGRNVCDLFCIVGNEICCYANSAIGAHNCQVYDTGIIYNDTQSDRVVLIDAFGNRELYDVVRYDTTKLINNIGKRIGRQGFARGLAFREDIIIGGSTPATISVYRRGIPIAVRTICLSMDVRYAIHGLVIYPDR